MVSRKSTLWALPVLLWALALVACRPAWQTALNQAGGGTVTVNQGTIGPLYAYAEEGDPARAAPLERVLAGAGHTSVESLLAEEAGGARHEFAWAEVADGAWWLDDGRLRVGEVEFRADRLEVTPSALAGRVQAQITDVAPTMAAVLDLPAPEQAAGRALSAPRARHGVIVLLDGLGYIRYTEAREAGLTPHLEALGEPLIAGSVFPPVTPVATAALLTGAPPAVNGVDRRGPRTTEAQTLFDVASAAGRRVVAVEGESLPFNLREAEVKLSGDRNGNDATDDEVLANALGVLQEGMPNLLFVHFHGIDDAGHTYGPGAPEEIDRVRVVDAAVGELMAALPPDTFYIVVADHGMHAVQEPGRLGNHGRLIERDMFVPLWTGYKP